MSQSMSAAPRKDPRGRRRPVGWHRAAVLEPKYRELHAQFRAERRRMSGRAGGFVYYWAYGRQCWRRLVTPRDPRTQAQQRARAAFGAASKAWSRDQALTEEQRDAWRADAAKIKSAPRLDQSGYLTAQQRFVGRNAHKDRWGLALLLEPREVGRKKSECRQKAELTVPQGVARAASGTRRKCTVSTPNLRQAADGCTGKPTACRVPAQVASYQALTRPSSERFPVTSVSLPMH